MAGESMWREICFKTQPQISDKNDDTSGEAEEKVSSGDTPKVIIFYHKNKKITTKIY